MIRFLHLLKIISILFQHPSVAQVAVVGIQDELKGQLPCAFFVLNKAKVDEKMPNSAEKVKSELVQMVRKEVGAVAAFKMAIAVKDIPRTRSGKTPRKVIADLASGRDFKVIFYDFFFYQKGNTK